VNQVGFLHSGVRAVGVGTSGKRCERDKERGDYTARGRNGDRRK
jgi:hypothetical protein